MRAAMPKVLQNLLEGFIALQYVQNIVATAASESDIYKLPDPAECHIPEYPGNAFPGSGDNC